ncbi:hypothetical protein ACFE04_004620 [Oxalis oulophora]
MIFELFLKRRRFEPWDTMERPSLTRSDNADDDYAFLVKSLYENSEMSPLQYAGSNLAKQFTRAQTNMTTDSQKRASGALGNRCVQEPVSNVLGAENSRSQERRSRMVEKNDNVDPADLNFDQTDKYMSNNKTDSHEIASGALGNRWVQEPVSNVLRAENSRSQERRSHVVEENDNVDPADLNFDQTDKYMSNNKTDSHEIASGAFGNRWVQEAVSNVSRAENSRSQERRSCMVEKNDNVDPADLNFDQTDKYMSNNKTDSHEIASGDTLKPRNWEDKFCAENIFNQKKQSPTVKKNDEVDHADPDLDRTDKDMYNKKTDSQETASDDIEKPRNWEDLAKQFTRAQTNMTTDSQKRASGALGNRWVQEPVSNVLGAENSRSRERRSRMVEKNDNVDPADLNFDQTDKYMSNNKTDSHEIASGALGNRWVQEPVSNVLGAENSRSQERRSHMVEKNDNVDPADLNFDQTDKYMSNNKTDSHAIASGDTLKPRNWEDKFCAENILNQKKLSPTAKTNDEVDHADPDLDQTDKGMSNTKTDSHEIASGNTLKPRNWEDKFCAENILNQKKQSPTVKKNDEVDHADPDLDRTDKDMCNKKTDKQETASDDIEKPRNWEDKFCAENILNQKKQSPTVKKNAEVDHADPDLDRTDKKTDSQETASDDIEKPRNWEDWSCAKNILNRKRKSLAVENNDETWTNEDKSQKLKMKLHIGEGIDRQLKTETDFGVILTEKGQKKILNKDQQISLHLKIRKKDEDLPKKVNRDETSVKKEVKDHESSQLTFREKLMDVLNRPYDDKECDDLWEHVCIRKPMERHRESRSGRTQQIVLNTLGRSHLDNYKRLAMEVENVKDDRRKLLYILRGYFFWLQIHSYADVAMYKSTVYSVIVISDEYYMIVMDSFLRWMDLSHLGMTKNA